MGSQPQQKSGPVASDNATRDGERTPFKGPLSGATGADALVNAWYANVPRFRTQTPVRDGVVTIGGRTYREVDDGRANVLVSTVSPAEQEERRMAMERIGFMANNPLAASAYGIAAAAGASPQMRDAALVGGAVLDVGTQGVAFGAPRPLGPIAPPPKQPPLASLQRERLRYAQTNKLGQAGTANALISRDMLGTGTKAKPSVRPPGLSSAPRKSKQHRGHLTGKQLGGLGDRPEQLVTMDQRANQSAMQRVENAIRRRVESGEFVELTTAPIYTPGVLAPTSILMMSNGARNGFNAKIIPNPARRQP